MSEVYSKEEIDTDDLRQFAGVALNALQSTKYGRKFKSSLAMITLCQGGANHYVVSNGYVHRYFDPQKKGLKDIDIWFFFRKKGFSPVWKLTRDFGRSKFGRNSEEPGYIGRRMDFFGRSIPFLARDNAGSALERWIASGAPGSSPWHLSHKAVVGIFPENIVGKVLWINPQLL